MSLRREDKEGGPARTFGVPSKSGKGVHEVVKWTSGVWSCDCTHWIIHVSKKPACTKGDPTPEERRAWVAAHSDRGAAHCSHVKDCIAGRVKRAGVVYEVKVGEGRSQEGRAAAAFTDDAI